MAVQGEIVKKNRGGRPLKYKTAKQLEIAIAEYFDYCDNRMASVYVKEAGDNVQISNPAPYTMSGLAYKLGIDRGTLLNYSNHDEFFSTIKQARMRVQVDVEQRLMEGKNQAGAIFNLKNNFGWVDQTQVDNKHEIVQPILGGLAKSPVIESEDAED
jgi:hypothetical protein